MQQIQIKRIKVGERIRELDEEHLMELEADIEEKGLLQAVVLTRHEAPSTLVCGEHRIVAVSRLHERGIKVKHNNCFLHPGFIPYVVVGELTPQQMLEYEVAENVVRRQLSWQDRNKAIAKLHSDLGSFTEEKQPSVTATAKALAAGGDKRTENAIRRDINRAEVIAQHLDNPEVAKAKTANEAWTIIQKDTRDLIGRMRNKYNLTSLSSNGEEFKSPHVLLRGPFQEFDNETIPNDYFDLILADPPYGADADKWTTKFKATPHAYDDSLEHALQIYSAISRLGYRWAKQRANLFLFCAPQYWHLLHKLVQSDGWFPWPRPIIWKKSNEGIRPHGTSGFAYTYEGLLYATKGGKGLVRSVNDVIEVYKVSNKNRTHGAQKPVELYTTLIDISCYAGDKIIDPCAGSGTIFEAAHLTGTIAYGCEIDPASQELCDKRIRDLAKPIQSDQMDLEDL